MTDREKTEVHLQITSGVLRLSTDDAVYYISAPSSSDPVSLHPGADRRMLPESMEASLGDGPPASSAKPMVTIDPSLSEAKAAAEQQTAMARKAQRESEYFQNLARKYHQTLGLLARRVSSDQNGDGQAQTAAQPAVAVDPGPSLERLAALQAEGEKIRALLSSFSGLEIMTAEEKNSLSAGLNTGASVSSNPAPVLENCLAMDNSALALLDQVVEALVKPAPAPAAPPPPPKKETKTVKRLFFPLNDLFQIVYELAIGEEVKKAIKVVWDGMAEFDEGQVNKSLAPLSESFEIDDGFVMVPLEPLFKAMFLASNNEAYRSTIKKLNANREKLFLDQSLPVEERYQEIKEEVDADAPAAPPPQENQPPAVDFSGLLAEVKGFREKLAAHLEELKAPSPEPSEDVPEPSPLMDQLLSAIIVRKGGSPELFQELAESEKIVTQHLAGLKELERIIQALAQASPLSAPAAPVQDNALILQLLNILVEFETRLNLSGDYVDSGGANIEGMVADKVAELRKKLGLGADIGQNGADVELDHKILNFLLSDMGF